MKPFAFDGTIPASKSILNRLLILQSYQRGIDIKGDSTCDDVERMRQALSDFSNGGTTFDCGAAGTTLRFLALRVSRKPGRYLLQGTPGLLRRPHTPLLQLLEQFSVQAEISQEGLHLESQGWRNPQGPLSIDTQQSTQFLSSLLLNSWDLPFPLEVHFEQSLRQGMLSQGYYEMTLALATQFGLQLERRGKGLLIPSGQRPLAQQQNAECDVSSAFVIAAFAALCGRARLRDFPQDSLQPDAVFPRILSAMGASISREGADLIISQAGNLQGLHWNLRDCPDLFPVLAVLCSFAEGTSKLDGAPHLAHKESNRLQSTAKLLRTMGAKFELKTDGMVIAGGLRPTLDSISEFDPMDDHRLAMAAALARQAGCPIKILHPEVVGKSYPEFWHHLEQAQGPILANPIGVWNLHGS